MGVAVGDEVGPTSRVVSVETAKAIVDISFSSEGRIETVRQDRPDRAHVGAPLVGFEGSGEDSDAGTVVGSVTVGNQLQQDAPAAVGRGSATIKAIPAVRALARQLNVELEMVTPSGRMA